MAEPTNSEFRAGYVAVVGKTNVGKSTFLNAVLGQKISIVSNKPQTTRRNVVGIYNAPNTQIAFVDTPGVHEAHNRLDRTMQAAALQGIQGVDVILVVADVSHHPGELDRQLAKTLTETDIPKVLALNKMDHLSPEHVLPFTEIYSELYGTTQWMLTQANRGLNLDKVIDLLVENLEVHPPMFDEDEITDRSQQFLAAEFVREKIMNLTKQEMPFATAVAVDSWQDDGDHLSIGAIIIVEKASQRGIIIGKGGQFLKQIGTLAREELEKLFRRKIYLDLHVRVQENWRMDPRVLQELDYSLDQ